MVLIIENPSTPDGAQIKLRNDKAFSPLRRALKSKVKKTVLPNNEDMKMLDDMAKLLGGGLG